MVKIYEVKNLYFSYGKNQVLKDINTEILKGEFVGIVGPNGSGKTTFLKILAKILFYEKGVVLYKGKDIKKINNIDYARQVGYLPSEIKFTFELKVIDFLIFGFFPYTGRFGKEDKEAIRQISEKLNIKEFLNKKITQLSEGEKQRIYIGQILVQNPEVILLDEPTSHLDIGYQFSILDILKDLNLKGITIISIFHDLNLASNYCTKILLFKEGEIYKSGSTEEVLTYKNIEEVYNTRVLVYKNPFTEKINVFGIPNYILKSNKNLQSDN
ncbi:MAG: ABC transporter ATP-binding protein [Candidatus Omnitrophica bacterium]|nr:ABC transporter ATP-binding protein [Candidatus Omnitrophota bacterium]